SVYQEARCGILYADVQSLAIAFYAVARRLRYSIQDYGDYRWYTTGILAFSAVTRGRPLLCSYPVFDLPAILARHSRLFFGNPVSSTTQATIGSRRSMDRAAIGSTLFRSRGKSRPVQWVLIRIRCGFGQALNIAAKRCSCGLAQSVCAQNNSTRNCSLI